MAPRRGGGGGGGGGSSSSGGPPSCGTSSTYPCSSELNYMYGHAWRPLWSEAENIGQLVVACLWAGILLISLICLIRAVANNSSRKTPPLVVVASAPAPHPHYYPHPGTPHVVTVGGGGGGGIEKTKEMRGLAAAGWPLQTGILLLVISFVFLAVRYGIIASGSNVLVGYRFESSIVVCLQRLGWPLVFYGLYRLATTIRTSASSSGSGLSRVTAGLIKVPFLLLLAAYTILNIVYLILDFLVSASALESFKHDDRWSWRLGDRDFSLTMNKGMIEALKMNAIGTGFAPGYVRWNMYDYEGEPGYLDTRWTQVKIGLAADVVAVVLCLLFLGLVIAGFVFGGRSHDGASGGERRRRRLGLLLVAGTGMFLSALFALVVTAGFVYHNMATITDPTEWFSFISAYEESEPDYYGLTDWIPPAGFLPSYRVTADGFPVVQAVLGPLGVVMACGAAVWLVWAEVKDEFGNIRVGDGGLYYEKRDERLG